MKLAGKIFVFVFILIFCGTAHAEKFPDLGVCTGNGVRLREDPNTESEIVGQLKKGDTFILLDVKKVDGNKWYLIDHPSQKGNAWIFGKYVKKYYKLKDSEHTPTHDIAMQIRLDYGITSAKTRALWGEPNEILRDVYGNFYGLKYDSIEINYDYDDEHLRSISIGIYDEDSEGNFGPVKIGDTTKKLREVFGKYIEPGEISWRSEAPSGEVMYFNIEDDKVRNMQWLIEEH